MHLQRCISEVEMFFKTSFLQYQRGSWCFAGQHEMSSLSSGTASGSGQAICARTEKTRRREAFRDRVRELGLCWLSIFCSHGDGWGAGRF